METLPNGNASERKRFRAESLPNGIAFGVISTVFISRKDSIISSSGSILFSFLSSCNPLAAAILPRKKIKYCIMPSQSIFVPSHFPPSKKGSETHLFHELFFSILFRLFFLILTQGTFSLLWDYIRYFIEFECAPLVFFHLIKPAVYKVHNETFSKSFLVYV